MQKNISGKKNKGVVSLVIAVIFALYSVVCFVLIGNRGTQFLTAYLFTVAAFSFLICSVWLLDASQNTLRDVFMGIPIWRECVLYAILQVGFSIIIMLLPESLLKITVVIQIMLLGSYVILVASSIAGKHTVENADRKVQAKRDYLGTLQVELQLLIQKESSLDVQKALNELTETVRFSDPMSSEELRMAEDEILDCIAVLQSEYDESTPDEKMLRIKNIKNKVVARNMRCKILK